MAELENQIKTVTDAFQKLQEVNENRFKEHEGSKAEQEAKLEKIALSLNEKAHQLDNLEAMVKRANKLGDNEAEKEAIEAKEAFNHYMRKGSIPEGMDAKALSRSSDPDGGYLVPTAVSAKIISRVFETSPIRAYANVETIGTDALEMVIDDNEATGATWVSESGSRAVTSTPQVGKKVIPIHEICDNPTATKSLLDDAAWNMESWLANKVADKFSRTENTAFVSGNGIGKPMGFLSYAAWSVAGTYQRDALEQVNSGSSGAFTADGLIELQNSLIEAYQANAVFVIRRSAFSAIRKLKDTANQYLLDIGIGGLANAQRFQLLGKPVVFANDMPVAAANSLSAAYGDFGAGYTIVDRQGIQVLRDPYTSKPFVSFYTTKRVGGDVTNFEAIKIQKLA